MTNNTQDNKGDRYSIIIVVVGIIIAWSLIEATYRILA
jgi:hypothetical protein